MIDNVPLIQNANDAQQINASIIAMKRASKELDEKILKLSTLNSELDKKIAILDNGLNKEIEDRKEAINFLDVPSVGGSGKYISAISETDGKISATASDLATTVASGNSQPVTSGGVYSALHPTKILSGELNAGPFHGYISSSSTAIAFLIPTYITKQDTVTVNALKVVARHVKGGYVENNAGFNALQAPYSIVTEIIDGVGIRIVVYKTSVFVEAGTSTAITNNTPISIAPQFNITINAQA